jgi:hypothetical protein
MNSPPTLDFDAPYTPDAPHVPLLHPMTPLGFPKTPPALPVLPDFVQPACTSTLPPTAAQAAQAAASTAEPAPLEKPAPLAIDLANAAVSTAAEEKEESWTPVAESQLKQGRRDFFHTDGKSLGFFNVPKPERVEEEDDVPIGEELTLNVEEIHFGNPRIRVMNSDPAPMKQMLAWPQDKFADLKLDCARISYGNGYRVWCAIGNRANRLAYAMKRNNVGFTKIVVVAAPPPPEEEDVDLTYGASIQGIQLVP